MRIRARVVVPALAAAALGIGAGGASAATLFTTAAHTTRVTVGATVTVTAGATGVDFTAPAGTVQNHCAAVHLGLTVGQNSASTVDLKVTSASLSSCTHLITITNLPWTATIYGNGTVSGSARQWPAEVHNIFMDLATIPGVWTGTLSGTGVTASQPTVGTAPVSIKLANASVLINPTTGAAETLDGLLTLSGAAAAWSLTD